MTVNLQALAIKSEVKVAMRYKNFKAVVYMRYKNFKAVVFISHSNLNFAFYCQCL